jgi:hypothetical protein
MATVFPFPLVKRGDLIRRHAESITSLSGEKQHDRIRQIVKSLYATMRAQGIAEELIEREITHHRIAVLAQLRRTQRYDDGAA